MSELQQLNEPSINLLGKIFFATIAMWLVGKKVNVKIRGTEEQVSAVSNAMLATKRFQDELHRSGASVESVMHKLNDKHAAAVEFEQILNVPWPL